MSTILTTRYHRDKASSDITTERTNNNPSRHAVFLTDFDQSKQTNLGQYFEEIPFNRKRLSPQVYTQIDLS